MTSLVRNLLSLLFCCGGAAAQPTSAWAGLPPAAQLVVPQSRAFPLAAGQEPIAVDAVHARVRIVEQTATTQLTVELRNPNAWIVEAVLLVPVPIGSTVTGFAIAGRSDGPTARVLPLDEARRTYDGIVAKMRDPALLEFVGETMVRSSVFPVEAGGKQTVRVTYEQVLAGDGPRVDYTLPRSASLEAGAPWDIEVTLASHQKIRAVYSPSHAIATTRGQGEAISVRIGGTAAREPGPFLLSFLRGQQDGVTASLFACPDPASGGGWFLLLAGAPERQNREARTPREVTLVLDRSGSMAGEKMDQARAAALQLLEELADGESFNIVDYATDVASFAPAPVVKDGSVTAQARAYLAALRPGGGTALNDALLLALRPPPRQGVLPIVLFLTDGVPTIGTIGEADIRAAVAAGNRYGRRVFTFGVGHDVNAPLLDWIAESTRGTTTYVQPQEDVEIKVSSVFRKLHGPVLASPQLTTLNENEEIDSRRVRDLHPLVPPDLFEDDQLVVLGRYVGDAPLRFRLEGIGETACRAFRFEFALDRASPRNAFVPRLWASRRIAYLVDQVRQAGATSGTAVLAGANPFADARLAELRDEIIDLSTRFGILSEYTAFLAQEGTRLDDFGALASACGTELDHKAMQTRVGIGAVNQGANLQSQKHQLVLNARNAYLDDQMHRVETTAVQQIGLCAFFRRGERWIDGCAIARGDLAERRVVVIGTSEYAELLRQLDAEGRAAVLSLPGDILVRIGDQNVLVARDGC